MDIAQKAANISLIGGVIAGCLAIIMEEEMGYVADAIHKYNLGRGVGGRLERGTESQTLYSYSCCHEKSCFKLVTLAYLPPDQTLEFFSLKI